MVITLGAEGATARYETDVVVVGGGIAGLATAVSVREAGKSVILVEKAPREHRGGNTRFADAQMRFPHEADEFGPRDYTVEQMYGDLMRISRGRANPDLIRTLCENARATAEWLTGMGLEWEQGYPTPRATVAARNPGARASSISSFAASRASAASSATRPAPPT